MKIFVDTAELSEIKEACSWGIVNGVTTNPSLIKKAVDAEKLQSGNVNMADYIKEICTVAGKEKPVSLEVISLTGKEMVREGMLLYEKFNSVAQNVVIKVPINTSTNNSSPDNYEGLKAIKKLSAQGIPVNCTLIMTPEQALLAAKAGAMYANPFAGRVDDYIRENLGISFAKRNYFDSELIERISENNFEEYLGDYFNEEINVICQDRKIKEAANLGKDNGIESGVDLVRSIVTIYLNYGIKTEIIAASMRNARQVREIAEVGAHIATIPFAVIKEMTQHPKTQEGVKNFSADVVPEYRELFKKMGG